MVSIKMGWRIRSFGGQQLYREQAGGAGFMIILNSGFDSRSFSIVQMYFSLLFFGGQRKVAKESPQNLRGN